MLQKRIARRGARLQKKSRQQYGSRQRSTLDGSFRRNNPVVSRSQRLVAEHKRSVTQRQFEKTRADKRRQLKRRVVVIAVTVILAALALRMMVGVIEPTVKSQFSLSAGDAAAYREKLTQLGKANSVARQSWTMDNAKISSEFIREFPEVKAIKIINHRPWRGSIEAEITFRTPIFTWLDASKARQFVDSEGVLFSVNRDKRVDETKLIHIEDQSGTVLDAGTSVLTASLMQFVSEIYNQVPPLYGKDAKIKRVIVPVATREVQIQLEGLPYVIRFNAGRGAGEQTTELKSLLALLNSNRITPSAYIDLRVKQKAFYK